MPVARHSAFKDARAELGRMHARLAALAASQRALRDLTEIAEAEVSKPVRDAAWPIDVHELADKILREGWGDLRSCESPVTNADRNLVLSGLPPCIEVCRDDVVYTH